MKDEYPATEIIRKNSAKWLKRLKKQSWEAELLVSTVSIFGIFQLFNAADWATNKFIDHLPPEQYLIGYGIVVTAFMAISTLVSMFVIHFFLRAYWVGLVGLNSVFPDYGLEDSAYSEIYTKKILSILPSQEETIQKVDELCSVIFSVAFCFLLIYAYFSLVASLYLILFNMLSDFIPTWALLIPAAFIALVFVLQTLIGMIAMLKKYKQSEKVQTWFFKIVKLGSMLMYGPLYKYLLQITMAFGSNFKKKKALIGLLLLFFLSGAFVSMVRTADSNVRQLFLDEPFRKDIAYATYYEGQNADNDFLVNPEMASDVLNSKMLRLFIPIYSHESANEVESCGEFENDLEKSDEENTALRRSFYLDCWKTYHQIALNGVKINADFIRNIHPRTGQFGILAYINSDAIKQGKNLLEVKKTSGERISSEWAIPFYYFPTE